MNDIDLNIIYKISKDLAFKYLKRYVPNNSVNLIIYKSCLDLYITKKTIWNSWLLLDNNGVIAIQANIKNLGDLVAFIEEQGYTYDVVFFHGTFNGRTMYKYYESVVPFVFLYKNVNKSAITKPNLFFVEGGSLIQAIAHKIINMFTITHNVVLFIGDLICAVSVARNLCRHIIGFGDDQAAIVEIAHECGVSLREVEL